MGGGSGGGGGGGGDGGGGGGSYTAPAKAPNQKSPDLWTRYITCNETP
jgi:hypothetical protein